MENFISNLTCLISKLNAELQKEKSDFPVYHLEIAISTFSLMYDNALSKSFGEDLSNNLDTIMHWSIDSWPWDSIITKKTWSIIEEYNKQSHESPFRQKGSIFAGGK